MRGTNLSSARDSDENFSETQIYISSKFPYYHLGI
jgi:hypothetical protein